MKCKYCHQINTIKKGKRNNFQRYYCKDCKRSFQNNYSYKAYSSETNDLIKNLLKEGCGIRSISRIINISTKTVLSRMLKISNEIKPPYFQKLGCKFEVDELWSFIGNKDNVTWITYAIERQTKTVINFIVGRKTSENIKPLINKLLLLDPKRIYTDRLNIYPSIIPKAIHKRFQYCTNIIERNNLTLRTHIKRLSRKTICFSKNEKYLEAHLRIYFWG
ncbi:IS1 family transposase [uncultured Psychroserpens sp.]|uniref:IS1 family transposase n=1 Tax=uncultured Psychroserpens sp. TaxID=255436 RepID=UPI002609F279|nr:IS1 family transposase [uncultured Psychroserpens sp.]